MRILAIQLGIQYFQGITIWHRGLVPTTLSPLPRKQVIFLSLFYPGKLRRARQAIGFILNQSYKHQCRPPNKLKFSFQAQTIIKFITVESVSNNCYNSNSCLIILYLIINNQMNKKNKPETLFVDLKNSQQPYKVESMCVNCQQNGTSTFLLTKIPFFREVMISAFQCPSCGYHNNEVQFAGKLSDFGVQILFRAIDKKDLNRELIKSEYSVIHFQEIDFEIPPNGKAEINTIEGYLRRAYDQLKFHQALRKIHEPQTYQKLEVFLQSMRQYIDGEKIPLTIKIRDPSGNSMIKNPYAPKIDKNLQITNFQRSLDQLTQMGYSQQNAKAEQQSVETKKICTKLNFTKPFEENNFMNQEAAVFEVPCHSCGMPGETRMCQTSIPYFSDLIIMSFSCQYCGAHSTQTKNSGQIKENASVLTLKVQGDIDLKRDLFKSQTCSVNLPQIELQLGYGTLGGVFTTVEGLIEKIYDHFESSNPFADSDSEFSARIQVLLQDLCDMREGKRPFTMILIDPLSHSFFSNPFQPNEDTRLTIEFRPRTFQENEDLGLNDINTENYKQEKKEETVKQQK